jgi:hypothetical protein
MREAGTGRTQGGRAGVSQGDWVDRLAHKLIRPLDPGDGPMDPSPYVIYIHQVHIIPTSLRHYLLTGLNVQ